MDNEQIIETMKQNYARFSPAIIFAVEISTPVNRDPPQPNWHVLADRTNDMHLWGAKLKDTMYIISTKQSLANENYLGKFLVSVKIKAEPVLEIGEVNSLEEAKLLVQKMISKS